jgi:hypothetical protein
MRASFACTQNANGVKLRRDRNLSQCAQPKSNMKKIHRRKISKSKSELFNLHDKALDHCFKIMSLAELLCHCSIERLHPDAVTCTSEVISQETKKLQENLETLYKRLSKMK